MGLFNLFKVLNPFKKTMPLPVKPSVATVLVFDDEVGIQATQGKPIGKPWRFKDWYVYCAKKEAIYDKESKEVTETLVPFDPLAKWRADSLKRKSPIYTPEDLYDAIEWREVGVVYKLGSDLLQKLNLWLMVVLVGILCFFIFLLTSNYMGK